MVAALLLLAPDRPLGAQLPPPLPDTRNDEAEIAVWRADLFDEIAAASDLGAAIDLLEATYQAEYEPERLSLIARQLATLYRASGRLSAATDAFMRAYRASGGTDSESLLDAAILLIETGEPVRGEQAAREVVESTDSYAAKRRATVLVASALALAGERETATRLLQTLASVDDSRHVEPEGLILLWQLLSQSEGAGSTEVVAQIERLFPGGLSMRALSPESRVSITPRPSYLTPAIFAGGDGRQPIDTADRALPEDVRAIQVGSFTQADRAEHFHADLVELGLEPRIDSSDGAPRLYRVVVPVQGQSDARETLSMLRDAGFDGIAIR